MAENLITLAKSYLTDETIGNVSTMVGESGQTTQHGFDSAFPIILGGLIKKSAEPGGPSSVMDLIGEVMSPSPATGDVVVPVGGISGQLDTLLNDTSESNGLLSMGAGIIQGLFGDKTTTLSESLSSDIGIKSSSASTLMSIAAPVLISVLGKKIATEGTGITGLTSLLAGQADYVRSALPSGVSSLLGGLPALGALSGLAGTAADPFGSATDLPPVIPEPLTPLTTPITTIPPTPPISTVPPIPPASEPIYPAGEPYTLSRDAESSDGGNRWLPWLLLALGAVALIYFLRTCQSSDKATTNTTTDSTTSSINAMADSVGSTVTASVDTLSVDMAKLGAFFKRTLPSGVELNIPEKGIENNLVQFIEDKNRPVDKTTWFNFGRLLFDTGKASLKQNAKEEVTNMSEILRAYPNVNIKIGGYTDNTGSVEVNRKLSQDRATTVMNELMTLGIDKSRLEAEGYGPEHPVASNETVEGRADNRRIAVRVTKK